MITHDKEFFNNFCEQLKNGEDLDRMKFFFYCPPKDIVHGVPEFGNKYGFDTGELKRSFLTNLMFKELDYITDIDDRCRTAWSNVKNEYMQKV